MNYSVCCDLGKLDNDFENTKVNTGRRSAVRSIFFIYICFLWNKLNIHETKCISNINVKIKLINLIIVANDYLN